METEAKVPQVGMIMEACDVDNIWSAATIIYVLPPKNTTLSNKNSQQNLRTRNKNEDDDKVIKETVEMVKPVTVRYKGWREEFDETIDYTNSKKVAKLGCYTWRFKCNVDLFNDDDATTTGSNWPCIVHVSSPSPFASLEEYKLAEEKLRLESRIFIEPYSNTRPSEKHVLAQNMTPEDRSSFLCYGGIWIDVKRVHKWTCIGNKSDDSSISHDNMDSIRMTRNRWNRRVSRIRRYSDAKFTKELALAYDMAQQDHTIPEMPQRLFEKGSLILSSYRTTPTSQDNSNSFKRKKTITINTNININNYNFKSTTEAQIEKGNGNNKKNRSIDAKNSNHDNNDQSPGTPQIIQEEISPSNTTTKKSNEIAKDYMITVTPKNGKQNMNNNPTLTRYQHQSKSNIKSIS